MKKSILFLVAFMLFGFSFAKAQFKTGITNSARFWNDKAKMYLSTEDTDNPYTFLKQRRSENLKFANQYWELRDAPGGGYQIVKSRMGKEGYLTVNPNQRDLSVTPNANGNFSVWTFERQPDGKYCIINKGSGTFIDVPRGSTKDFQQIIHFKGNRDENQRFVIFDQQGNRY